MPSWHFGRPVTSYTGLCCPRPSSAEKENCRPRQMGLAGLSAEPGDSDQQGNKYPCFPSIPLYPSTPIQASKEEKHTKQQQQMQAIAQELYREGEADCNNFWAVPCTSSQNTDYKAGNVPHRLSQSAPHPGLVLRSLTGNQQSTLTHSLI